MPKITAQSNWLRAGLAKAKPIGVDRENNVIHGYVLAERGPFKSAGRGEFDDDGLRQIVALAKAKPAGLKSRFTHPSLSDDGLGKFLGRSKNVRMDGPRVRGDLHLSAASHTSPSGDLGKYVMDLAESDPGAFGSSLVLEADEKMRLDAKGHPLADADGEPLPPLWYPKVLHASDVVDEGDAVHNGFLSSASLDALDLDNLPDAVQRQGWAMLDRVFAGSDRGVIEARCLAYLNRYLSQKFGEPPAPAATPRLDALRDRLDRAALAVREFRGQT